LATAKELVPQSVADIDALVVQEVSDRLHEALGRRQWPVEGVTVEQAAEVLQATSYGLKQQTDSRSDYLVGMQSAVGLILTAGRLIPSANQVRPRTTRPQDKGAQQ
jgi:hypothetical protein